MAIDQVRFDEFLGRAVNDMGAAMSGLLVVVGDRLGLYTALAEVGGVTTTELADRAGIAERYAREWLEQQTAAGIVRADGKGDGVRFTLPAGHAEVLLDRDSLSYMAPTVRSLMMLTPA